MKDLFVRKEDLVNFNSEWHEIRHVDKGKFKFLDEPNPQRIYKIHRNSAEKLENTGNDINYYLNFLTAVEVWLKTHISTFAFYKQNQLVSPHMALEMPYKISYLFFGDTLKNAFRESKEDLLKIDLKEPRKDKQLRISAFYEFVKHDLNYLLDMLGIFIEEKEDLIATQKVVYGVNQKGDWTSARYDARKVDLPKLSSFMTSFDKLASKFDQDGINIFRKLEE